LDNYAPLREVTPELLKKKSHIFKIKDGLMFIPTNPLGLRGKSAQGESYYSAPNPEYGVTFTYYVKDKTKSLKETRQAKEKELSKAGKDVFYPSMEDIFAEDNEEKPYLLFIIKDANGVPVRKIKTGTKSGINRISWNFRLTTTSPIKLSKGKIGRYSTSDEGPLALPGAYTVELYESINGKISLLHEAVQFNLKPLNNQTLLAKDKAAVLEFQNQLAELRRRVSGASTIISETNNKIKYLKSAIQNYPSVPIDLLTETKTLENEMLSIQLKLHGNKSRSRREFETYPSISSRIGTVVYQLWHTTTSPTTTQKQGYEIAKEEFEPVMKKLNEMVGKVASLEEKMTQYGVPYTPGRTNSWKLD
jgi:hypothetical protein